MTKKKASSLYDSIQCLDDVKSSKEFLTRLKSDEIIELGEKPCQLRFRHGENEYKLRIPFTVFREQRSLQVKAIDANDEKVVLSEDILVSRAKNTRAGHAAFLAVDGDIVVQDLGSLNGTQVNQNILKDNEKQPIKIGDTVTLGNTSLLVTQIENSIQMIKNDDKLRRRLIHACVEIIDGRMKDKDAYALHSDLNRFRKWWIEENILPQSIQDKMDTYIKEANTYDKDIVINYTRDKWVNEIKPMLIDI